jgi:hypothetical protein
LRSVPYARLSFGQPPGLVECNHSDCCCAFEMYAAFKQNSSPRCAPGRSTLLKVVHPSRISCLTTFLLEFIRSQYSLPAPFWRSFNIGCRRVDAESSLLLQFLVPSRIFRRERLNRAQVSSSETLLNLPNSEETNTSLQALTSGWRLPAKWMLVACGPLSATSSEKNTSSPTLRRSKTELSRLFL